MQITIHRGSREIGGSCIELKSGNDRLILELGVPLSEKNGAPFDMQSRSEASGPNLVSSGVLPAIPGLYSWDKSPNNLKGLLLSHHHMDHCGFIGHVHPAVPVFSGQATHRLLELHTLFTPFEGVSGDKENFKHGHTFSCGCFRVTPYIVDHSAFDAYAFLIEADHKRLLYSGDFRNHGRKKYAFPDLLKSLRGRQNDAVLLEGTKFGRSNEKIKTELDLEEEAVNLLHDGNTLALLAVSAHNIDRLVTFYRVAKRCDRILVVDLYTANILKAVNAFANIPCPSADYDHLKVFFPYQLTKFTMGKGLSSYVYPFKKYKITREQIITNQNNYIMMVRPSMLSDLRKLKLPSGLRFIYSMWEGNKGKKEMADLLDFAQQKKMEISNIHTSGHATLETLKEFIVAAKPGLIIPIHTSYPERYSELEQAIKLLGDGEVFQL